MASVRLGVSVCYGLPRTVLTIVYDVMAVGRGLDCMAFGGGRSGDFPWKQFFDAVALLSHEHFATSRT